jgi:hypothetical protein
LRFFLSRSKIKFVKKNKNYKFRRKAEKEKFWICIYIVLWWDNDRILREVEFGQINTPLSPDQSKKNGKINAHCKLGEVFFFTFNIETQLFGFGALSTFLSFGWYDSIIFSIV